MKNILVNGKGGRKMDLVRDKRVKDALMNSTVQNMFERGELRKAGGAAASGMG